MLRETSDCLITERKGHKSHSLIYEGIGEHENMSVKASEVTSCSIGAMQPNDDGTMASSHGAQVCHGTVVEKHCYEVTVTKSSIHQNNVKTTQTATHGDNIELPVCSM